MKNLAFIFIVCVVPFLSSCEKANTEQSNWRGPERTGFYPETELLTEWPENGPELLWKYENLGIGYTSAAVTDEYIYITGTKDSTSYIYSLDLDGNLIWEKNFGLTWKNNYPGVRSTPVIKNGLGYVLTGRGVMVCFDIKTGEKVWETDWVKHYNASAPYFGFSENFLIDGDKVYCTPGDTISYNVLALNRFNGEIIWKSEGLHEISAYASPTIIEHNNQKQLVTFTSKSLIALNPENGKLIWSFDMKYPSGIHGNIPIYEDGYIFAMNGWGFGSKMLKISDDGKSVEKVWENELFDLEHGDALKIGSNLYGSSWNKKVFSVVDWKTGEVKDSLRTIGPSSVIAAEGLIYSFEYSGKMNLVKPTETSFEIVSSFNVSGKKKDHIAHPVIKDKRLYIRYANELLVYSIEAKQ